MVSAFVGGVVPVLVGAITFGAAWNLYKGMI